MPRAARRALHQHVRTSRQRGKTPARKIALVRSPTRISKRQVDIEVDVSAFHLPLIRAVPDLYRYMVVLQYPGEQMVRWVKARNLQQAIEIFDLFMRAAGPDEMPARSATVQRRLAGIFGEWETCWPPADRVARAA